MITLFRFEDTYGLFYVFCKVNGFDFPGPSLQRHLVKLSDVCFVEFGLGRSAVLTPTQRDMLRYMDCDIDRVVFVFDSDNECDDVSSILSLSCLNERLDDLTKMAIKVGWSGTFEFSLLGFSSETILLYQCINSDFDIDSLVHPVNINRFQCLLLRYQYGIRSNKLLKRSIGSYFDMKKLKSSALRSKTSKYVHINQDVLDWVCNDFSVSFSHSSSDDVRLKLQKLLNNVVKYRSSSRQLTISNNVDNRVISTDIDLDLLKSHI